MSPAEPAPPRWRLHPIQVPGLTASIPVDEGGLTLGRDARNAVAMPDAPGVSATHARVAPVGDRLLVEDLGSKNGLWVEGAAVARAELEHGGAFELGPGGPRFFVLSASKVHKTVAFPRPDLASEKRAQESETLRSLSSLKSELGLAADEDDIAAALAARTRRQVGLLSALALAILGAIGFGFHALQRQDAALHERTAGLARATADLAELARTHEAALSESRRRLAQREAEWSAWSARIDAARGAWEEQKTVLEDEQARLENDIRRVQEDERSATGELADLRARLEATTRDLRRYNPVNLEQERLARVSAVERCTVLIEADLRYREPTTGRLLHVEREGRVGTFNLEGRGEPFARAATGSGFCVTADGWILTNAHVVHEKSAERALEVGADLTFVPDHALAVVFSGTATRHAAELVAVAADGAQDLALLKIAPFEGMPHLDPPDLTLAPPGNGTDVFLIGFPLGKSVLQDGDVVIASAFRGIVSRTVGDYLQVDAAVHPGASGGPVIDAQGRIRGVVVGMQPTEMPESGSSIGFVIPVAELTSVWPPRTAASGHPAPASATR